MIRSAARSLIRFGGNLIDTPALILLYHRVTVLPADPQLLSVSPDNFHDHVSFLKKNYNLINLEEFTSCIITRKKLPKKTVVLTFDDGYADNYLEALPILESLKTQALFYIATANLNTRNEFWWDDLERIFLNDHKLPGKLQIDLPGNIHSFSTSSDNDRKETYDSLHPIVKNNPAHERDELMFFMREWAGLPKEGRTTHRAMTSQELLSMAKSPSVVIGAHTHNHPKLSVCTPENQRQEINQSKQFLEKLLEKPVAHFSYPFGSRFDYTLETVNICKELGFKVVSANVHNQLHSWHSPFELPRVLIRNWNLDEFAKKVHTFFRF